MRELTKYAGLTGVAAWIIATYATFDPATWIRVSYGSCTGLTDYGVICVLITIAIGFTVGGIAYAIASYLD